MHYRFLVESHCPFSNFLLKNFFNIKYFQTYFRLSYRIMETVSKALPAVFSIVDSAVEKQLVYWDDLESARLRM